MRLSETNSLAALAPDIAAELDPALNGGRTAAQVLAGSRDKFTWRCRTDARHIWVTSPSNRTWNGHGCPSCATTGYRPGLPGYLYLLRREADGVEQRKIGITNVPDRRLRKLRRYAWEPLEVSPAMNGAAAYRLERAVIAMLVNRGLRCTKTNPSPLREDGYTETWEFAQLPANSIADLAEIVGEEAG